ncbi:hypothetical protein BDC45DRAFT_603034 [Circinella umbellata]|nr:hypothetical protein BDC45DRAFT_603034 [Circinella umbellata]
MRPSQPPFGVNQRPLQQPMGDPNRPPPPSYPQGAPMRQTLPPGHQQPPMGTGTVPPVRPGVQQPQIHPQLTQGFRPTPSPPVPAQTIASGRPPLQQPGGGIPPQQQQIDHTMSPSTQQQQLQPGTSPLQNSTSPTVSQQQLHTDHHRRKRMYPQQITKAYMDDPSEQTQQQPQINPSSPAYGQSPVYSQQQPMQQQQGSYGYGQGVNSGVNNMTSQFGNMSLSGSAASSMPQAVALSGVRPQISDLMAPQPPIRLPPNTSITESPFANCDPSYKCSTLNAFPATEQLLKKSRLPLALVLAPYRTVSEGESPVPVVSDGVIARCRRCRTYINPYVTFVEGGQRWKCNMCFLLNDVPAAFDYDAVNQQPMDRWKRSELNYGCVEFVAPTEYMVRPPQAPAYVFVIDVSHSAIQSGMLATAARTILDSLDRIPNKENRTSIAIITVDSSLHFYNLTTETGEAEMLVISDIDDVFIPHPGTLLANLTKNMESIKSLLERLPDMFKETVNVNNALGSALQAAYKLVCNQGGKIICLQSTLPNAGVGTLKLREDVKLLGTPKETTLLNAASPFYKSFAVDCSRSQVSCDMLIFGGQYSDVATLSCLPHYTGGQTYYYPGFNAARTEDAFKFAHEFSELLAEKIGLEAVIRIRASRGLRMNAFHGNFFIRSTDLLALPNVPRNQSYCVEVVIEDDIKTPTICFQTALLHTTCHGERRIRVVTLCLPVTNSISEIYANANEQAIADYFANKGVERALSSKLDDARDAIVNKTIDIFGVYKTHVLGSGPGSTPQLTGPSNLKLLPLLALCLIKHDGLRQSSQIPTDLRANAMNLLRTMPLQLLLPYLYPNLYALHNMSPEAGEISENGVTFPPALNLTVENLEPHGCYLLENGQNIYLWVGRGVVPQLCVDLFDVKSYDGLRGGKITMPLLETPINKKVNLIIGKIREMRRGNYYPTLYLIKEDGDPYLRLWFLSHLIEDRTDNIMSYQQFLQHIKDRVSNGSY